MQILSTMMNINSDYKYTEDWSVLEKIQLDSNSIYLYGGDPEDRSEYCAQKLMVTNPQCNFINILFYNEDDTIAKMGNDKVRVSLYETQNFASFLGINSKTILFIDITGISCRVIAPILQYAINNNIEVRTVYVEPKNYKIEEFRKIGINKDLCETVGGIDPLPGMAHIFPHRNSPVFVVLLGFEGGRFSQIVQDQSPDYQKIFPVLGVPGYQINYPYISMWGNKYPLINTKSWQRLHYAEANSVVDIYMKLSQIAYENRDSDMVVAPIGTKPHAVGAILYSIQHPEKVEIIYDNPIRKVNRSEGVGRVLMCNVTKLINDDGRA